MYDRRSVLKIACGCAAFSAFGPVIPTAFAAGGAKTTLSADEALALLKEGNAQFLADDPEPVLRGEERRLEVAKNQQPFAVLLACADSRVAPELLFNRGLGELFTIRNAGNTVDTVALGSIEYGVAELGVPLVVVMGHQRCGAVTAAVDIVKNNATFPGSIGPMVEPIVPAVLKAQSDGGEDLVEASVRANVARVVDQLRIDGPIMRKAVDAGSVKVVGARYGLDDGRVEFLEG